MKEDMIGLVEALRPETAPNAQSPEEILAEWRDKIEEERTSERSCLKHGMPDQSKWHEGKADAIERCADVLEYHIIKLASREADNIRQKVSAAISMLSPFGNQATSSVMAIREALRILRSV